MLRRSDIPDAPEKAILRGRLLPAMRFDEKVWAVTARVPAGRVTTYGEIARTLGSRAYRAVGGALRRNPYAPGVPCHRVVGSDGAITGYAHGVEKKAALLRAEGVEVARGRVALTKHFVSVHKER